jgi:hypothetical protein
MKTKKIQKKLVLNKETIVSLETNDMEQAKAGQADTFPYPVTIPPSIFPWFCFVSWYTDCDKCFLPE